MENRLFPFTDPEAIEANEEEVPLAKEYAYDFNEGDFKLRDGKLYIVEGKEAVKIWIEKILRTSRYKEVIFSWSFGNEFEDKIIGKGYTKGLIKAEVERYTREAINASLSNYVTSLHGFDIQFEGNLLTIAFNAETIYGEVGVVV